MRTWRDIGSARAGWVVLAILAIEFPLRGQAEADAAFDATSLEAYLKRAQAANPDLRAFEERYRAAMHRIPQAAALPDPKFQITHFAESVQTRTGPQENVIMLSQTLPWFGKLGNRETGASAEAEALWYAYKNKQLNLARVVALAFYEYGYTGRAVELTGEILRLLEDLEPIVEEKVKAGGDLTSLLRLKVEIGRVSDRFRSLHEKRQVQSADLNALLALSADSILPWPIWKAPATVSPDGGSLALSIEANNPELAMLEHKITSAEAQRELARLESYPDVTLGFNYIQLGESFSSSGSDSGKDPWGFTISVNVPIWFGKYRAARQEALSNISVVENERAHRSNELKAELSASLASLRDGNRRLRLFGDELLGLAKQAVEISTTSYESGRTGILEVIDSERSLLELQLLYWRAAADAWQSIITTQTLANQPIHGSIDVTNER